MGVTNRKVEEFWEKNPVVAEAILHEPGTPEFFATFDGLREMDVCEPWDYSNHIHGYTGSRGLRVLDIGCGNGYVLKQYAAHGAETHGIDITETALKLSRARFEQAGLAGSFTKTDGDKIPYPDDHFDIVCSMGVLHHIADPRPMIAEMYRVLKPGGRMIAMLYYRWSWKHLVIHRLKQWFDPAYKGKSLQEVLNMNDGDGCPLALVYTKKQSAELFAAFAPLEMELNQLSWRQFLLLPQRIAPLFYRILPKCSRSLPARLLGWNLYIRGRKPA